MGKTLRLGALVFYFADGLAFEAVVVNGTKANPRDPEDDQLDAEANIELSVLDPPENPRRVTEVASILNAPTGPHWSFDRPNVADLGRAEAVVDDPPPPAPPVDDE